MSETVRIGVQVPKELADAIAEIAKAQDRTLSAEVRRALREHVKREHKREAASA